MARTFILSSTTSDLSGGADFSAALVETAGTAGSYAPNAAASTTDVSMAWTATGVPGTGGTSTGTFTVEVNVTAANSAVQISTQLHRVNSAGTVQASSSTTAEQSGGSTGVKTFTHTNPALGTWAAGDRLRVDYRFRNSNTMGGQQSVTIETETVDAQVATPFASPPQNVNVGQAAETDAAQAATLRLGKRIPVGLAW